MEEGGFLYTSDVYADDLPYWLAARKAAPRRSPTRSTQTTCASPRRRASIPASSSSRYLKDSFDMLYAEGETGAAKMMSVGLHCRLAGRPAAPRRCARFLDYVQSRPEGVAAAPHRHRPPLDRAPQTFTKLMFDMKHVL